jgi:hypothetical protein
VFEGVVTLLAISGAMPQKSTHKLVLSDEQRRALGRRARAYSGQTTAAGNARLTA